MAITLIPLLTGLGAVMGLPWLLIERNAGAPEILLIALTSLGGLAVGVLGLSSRYQVDLSGIRVGSIYGEHYIAWRNVERIHFQTNYFGTYRVFVAVGGGRSRKQHQLALGLVGNANEIAKAVLEAASKANPSVRVTGAHHFGPPPYGVFGELQAVANE